MKQQSKKNKIQQKDQKARKSNGAKQHKRPQTSSQTKKWQPSSVEKPIKKQQSNHQHKHAQLQNLPTIQNILQLPQAERSKKIPELFKKIKPFLQNYMIKKQGSRVLQLMLKWGNPGLRHEVNTSVKKNWKELLKSKYAIHVIGKLAKQKDCQLDQLLINDCYLLQQTKQSALVLQNYLKRNIQSQNSKKLIFKFNDLATRLKLKDLKAEEMLQNLCVKSIQKEYYTFHISKLIIRMALPILFEQEKQNVVQFLVERVAQIVCDEEGIKLFISLYNYCSAKQKKTIVKAYKGYVHQVLQNNNVSYVSIIKIILDTDDTVMIGNSLLQQVIALLPLLIEDQRNQVAKRLFMTVFSIFSPRNHNFNVLSKYEHDNEITSCKKSENDRKKELRGLLYEPLLQFLTQENIEKICRQPTESKLMIGIVRAMLEDKYDNTQQFLEKVISLFLNSLKQKNEPIQNSLIADANAHKVLKNIILLPDNQVDKFCDRVANDLLLQLQKILKTKCSYVLLGLIEKGSRNWILEEIKKRGINLSKDIVAGQHFQKLLKGDSGVSKNRGKTMEKQANRQQKQATHENFKRKQEKSVAKRK